MIFKPLCLRRLTLYCCRLHRYRRRYHEHTIIRNDDNVTCHLFFFTLSRSHSVSDIREIQTKTENGKSLLFCLLLIRFPSALFFFSFGMFHAVIRIHVTINHLRIKLLEHLDYAFCVLRFAFIIFC